MAAETNDLGAHLRSLQLEPNSVAMLNGQRYDNVNLWRANQWYKIPESAWNSVRDNPGNGQNGFIQLLRWYVTDHYNYQLPRLLELERDYEADGPIHYWKSHKYQRADNRISNAFGEHVTEAKKGLLFGKPIKYGYANHDNGNDHGTQLLSKIKDFNTTNDTAHHDASVGRDALVTGRAYELTYVEANTNIPKVKTLNPSQCFVIWSTDIEPKELCAVRYYVVRVANRHWFQIEVYSNNGNIYYYKSGAPDGDWQPLNVSGNSNVVRDVYNRVPITEFRLNDTRQGCFEDALDFFDAYDKAVSAMANSQEDFNNTTLVISGKVHQFQKIVPARIHGNRIYWQAGKPHKLDYLTYQSKDKYGNRNDPAYKRATVPLKSNYIQLEPYVHNDQVVSQPTAQYLAKSLDANEWQVYINELVTRIQQFTGVPNMNNDATGNQTELETASRLLDMLNGAAEAESNFRHGIKRRIELLYSYWTSLGANNGGLNGNNGSDPTNVTVNFDLNLPLNVQETIQKIQVLNGTNKFSTQTIQEMAASITGVPQSEEANRLSSESSVQQSQNSAELNNGFSDEVSASNSAQSADSSSDNAPNIASNDNQGDNHAPNYNNGTISNSSASDNDSSVSNDDSASQSASNSSNDSSDSISNSHVDNNGSSTSEVMDPNSGFDSNGSVVSLNDSAADDMALVSTIMDSLYASGGGYPSGFDSVMSAAVSKAASNSVSTAAIQSASIDASLSANSSSSD